MGFLNKTLIMYEGGADKINSKGVGHTFDKE